jgi:hypothetical protein
MGGGVSKSTFHTYLKDSSSFRWEDSFLPVLKDKSFKGIQFPANGPLLVASQSKDIAAAAHMLAGEKDPSTALHAFLTFTPICDRVSLYGFEQRDLDIIADITESAQPFHRTELRFGMRAGHTGAFKWLERTLELFPSRVRVVALDDEQSHHSGITAEL